LRTRKYFIDKDFRNGYLVTTGVIKKARYEMRCDCGRLCYVSGEHVPGRYTCGNDECSFYHLVARQKNFIHGNAGTQKDKTLRSKEYQAWDGITQKIKKDYKIEPDEKIRTFLDFIKVLGYAPSPIHRLCRIDTLKPFTHDNLEWRISKRQRMLRQEILTD